MVIPIGNKVDKKEIDCMASSKSFILPVKSFAGLRNRVFRNRIAKKVFAGNFILFLFFIHSFIITVSFFCTCTTTYEKKNAQKMLLCNKSQRLSNIKKVVNHFSSFKTKTRRHIRVAWG